MSTTLIKHSFLFLFHLVSMLHIPTTFLYQPFDLRSDRRPYIRFCCLYSSSTLVLQVLVISPMLFTFFDYIHTSQLDIVGVCHRTNRRAANTDSDSVVPLSDASHQSVQSFTLKVVRFLRGQSYRASTNNYLPRGVGINHHAQPGIRGKSRL